jgi:hypothetical protein
MRVLGLPLAALLAAAAACASGKTTPSQTTSPSATAVYNKAPAKKNPRVISEQELQDPSITSRDALTAIRHLRPACLVSRGPTGSGGGTGGGGDAMVSVDYGPLQSSSYLSTITTQGLKEVRCLDSNDAQNRFGLNANGGPVVVLLYNKQP